jgi:SAM-dependent methyltransferase
MFRHRGTAVECPICGGAWDAFKDDWNRGDALCWRCGSHERHRAQWLLLRRRPELIADATGTLLHFAPEHCLRGPLARLTADRGIGYVTADLDPTGVDRVIDLMAVDAQDDAFGAVICSHVLEHVPDADVALRELRRITAPGGWCLLAFPLDLERATTYEDRSITSPDERLAAYWQPDHVRLFGRDAADRIASAGFTVEVVKPVEAFGEEAVRRQRLLPSDWLFLCR